MGVIIGIVIVGVLIYICVCNDKERNHFEQNENIEVSDVLSKYIGGFPDIEGGKEVYLGVNINKIIIKFYDKGNTTKIINIRDVTKAEIQSETQINQSVNLGQLVIFGVLAFGMKRKSEVNSYLLLGYKDNNEERNLILESRHLESITKTIRKYAFN